MIHAAMMHFVAVAVAVTVTGLSPAFACACCSFVGQRSTYVQKFNTQLEQFSFRNTAKLVLGERDDHPIPGMEPPVSDFTVTVAQLKDRIAFSFRDAKDRAGTLSLVRPRSMAIFEVDPRDTVDHGTGPNLYKEWTITTRSGRRRHLPQQQRAEPPDHAGAARARQFLHRLQQLYALDARGARTRDTDLYILRRARIGRTVVAL